MMKQVKIDFQSNHQQPQQQQQQQQQQPQQSQLQLQPQQQQQSQLQNPQQGDSVSLSQQDAATPTIRTMTEIIQEQNIEKKVKYLKTFWTIPSRGFATQNKETLPTHLQELENESMIEILASQYYDDPIIMVDYGC